MLSALATALLAALALAPAPAVEEVETTPPDKKETKTDAPERSEIHGKIVIEGQDVPYLAVADMLPLKTEGGKVRARVFHVAYLREDQGDRAARPITFAFNGGPGSSSVWLHLGAFGPRVVALDDEGFAPPPPFALRDNDRSLLDVTDLVFIDPVTTGYSRAAEGEDARTFHGLDEDVEAVGEFIRLYCSREGRWASPKFLAGESYGTTRASHLARHLQDRHGLSVNGIVLISAILDFQTTDFRDGNDLPYVLYLPTYAATAFFHDRLDPSWATDLRTVLEQAESFALGDYAHALLQGDRLEGAKRTAIAARLAALTGLSPGFVEDCDLRVRRPRFDKELLRDRGVTVGRLDSRFTGRDRDDSGASPEYDPSYANIQGAYSAALNHYVRQELGYETDLPYEVLTGRVQPWNFGRAGRGYPSVAESLREALNHDPHLRVFVASGFFDSATPYFAARHTFAHLGLRGTAPGRVTFADYEAGHMMYIRRRCLLELRRDLLSFYAACLPGR